jgi:hypothetical protein
MEPISRFVNYLKKKRIVSHILFWGTLFILELFRDLIVHDDNPTFSFPRALVYNATEIFSQVVASYFIVYFWIPKFIKPKKYFLSILVFSLGIYFSAIISRSLVVYIAEPFVRTPPFEQETFAEILTDYRWLIKHYIPSILQNSLLFVAVKFFLDERSEREKKLKLAKGKVELELNTLKGQLNPHFLFNTLNNIYSLSIDNSPKTTESIAKLSEMLDQVLYKNDSKFVPLESELALIENYIELEKLRYDERLKVSLTSDIQHKIQIPSLILLSLVENAFKHGAGEDDGSPVIDIIVKSRTKTFTFCVKNSISAHYKTDNKKTIGLVNIRKQLDLIYGNLYHLQINPQPTEFIVTLAINL